MASSVQPRYRSYSDSDDDSSIGSGSSGAMVGNPGGVGIGTGNVTVKGMNANLDALKLQPVQPNNEDQDQDDTATGSSTAQQKPKSPRKPRVEPEAAKFLSRLPGMHTPLKWAYSARIVTSTDPVYSDILEYVRNGQEHKYGIKVKQILRIVRNGDIEFHHDKNVNSRFRMILWHGTKLAKVAPILARGFQLPQPTNQMFGRGVYFADRISKSCNYGDGTSPGSKGYLFLCDVFLGNVYNAKGAHNQFTEAPKGFAKDFDSVMCTGQNVPDRSENKKMKGALLPCGKTITNTKFSTYTVQYNEYIVYDVSKIRIKYLVKVEFAAHKCH